MVSCIVVDDEHVAREGMKLLIEQINFLEMKGAFASVIEADRFLEENQVDILFLDIHMPNLDGMEYLKLRQNKALVVFTTAYSDRAIDAFEYGAIDYLLKPIRFERFYKAVLKASSLLEGKKKLFNPQSDPNSSVDQYFFVKHERKILRFNYSDIQVIEGLKDYSLIHARDNRVDVPMNLKTIEKLLPPDVFIRVNKSHIINLTHVSQIEFDVIKIFNHHITLSPIYKSDFYARVINTKLLKKK